MSHSESSTQLTDESANRLLARYVTVKTSETVIQCFRIQAARTREICCTVVLCVLMVCVTVAWIAYEGWA